MNTRQPVSGLGTQHPGTKVRRVHSNIEGQDGCVEWGEACGIETVRALHLSTHPSQAHLPHRPCLPLNLPSKSLASRSTRTPELITAWKEERTECWIRVSPGLLALEAKIRATSTPHLPWPYQEDSWEPIGSSHMQDRTPLMVSGIGLCSQVQ